MQEPKTILVAEDDEKITAEIEHGLFHLVSSQQGIPLRILKTVTPNEALELAEANNIDLMILDITLKTKWDGIELAKEIRKIYPYISIIVLTSESSEIFKGRVHDDIKFARFFTKPVNWDKFAKEVVYQLHAPSIPKEEFLPIIKSGNEIFRIPRSEFLFLRGVKGKKKVEIFTVGANPDNPEKDVALIYKYGSFNNFAKHMIASDEKELVRCERVTIVNKNKIKKVNMGEHYLLLFGTSEKIWIDRDYRDSIYGLFKN